MEENMFRECLSETVRRARLHQNHITREEIDELFRNMLSPEQTAMVEEYLKNMGIRPGTSGEDVADEDQTAPEEQDVSFLQMYLDELGELPERSEDELRMLKQAALDGEEAAKAALVQDYLPKVVEIARLYTGQGVSIEDLIGEGNIGLMMGFELLSCVESVEEIEGHLGAMIMDAMDAAIARGSEDREFDRKMLEKVEEIAAKAKELSELLRRDVTVSELSGESGIDGDEIRQALEMTGGKIEGITVTEEI